ncbi:DNA polymerase III subunit delta [Brevibacterium sp. BRM-1]|uniref:DNA polymerase III subunit delta n=1 Tax=Brevibacterium sp. BRM-1 TaxID=2999062 RepID=UPI00228218C0|nr:DNA polymerase III subunit delta [Brevibacterium sp. BRM-1]WAL40955.1 DNA polymerase III subunit delta [Brevibacterium sp. BRM-1]
MAAKKTSLTSWRKAAPAPVVLIQGSEAVLVRRAQDRIIAAARRRADPETTFLDAAAYAAGELDMACAPSLFSAQKLVVVDSLAGMSDDFLADALAYVADPNPDAMLILKHGGGNRGQRLLKAIEAGGHPRIDAKPLTSDADKQAYAQQEFDEAQRRIEPEALAALLAALGQDLSELAAGVEQLLADTQGPITTAVVDRYYGGRVEATGFKVADAAVAGRGAEALGLLRHALATGTDPVPIVAAVALKLRQLAKVQGVSGSAGKAAAELKMAPWQVDRARREARQWNEVALGEALMHAAAADEAVKGGGRDPVYAVERLVAGVARRARVR